MTNDLANAARIMSERIVRLEAHQGINEQKIEEQTREIERLRARAYKAKCAAPGSHSSACITWGDDGQGKGQENPNACSCGAWPEWLKARIEAALAKVEDEIREVRETGHANLEALVLIRKALKGE